MKTVHILVAGRVQGVFYRAETRRLARECAVTGWVKNLPDGRVEAVASGETGALGIFLEWMRRGPPNASVTDLQVEEIPQQEFAGFEIR